MNRKLIYQKHPLRPYILIVMLLFASTLASAQTPLKSDELVNSIGVNVHFSFGESPYHQQYDSARNLLGEIGIRFIRDRIDLSESRRNRQKMDWWDQYGVQIAGMIDAKENVGNGQYPRLEEIPELLRIAREEYGTQRIVGLMGLNEWDISRDTTSTGQRKSKSRSQWVSEWRLQQRTLYDAVKSDPVLSAVPVVMSPLANSFNIEFLERTEYDSVPLGEVSDMVDIGNDHPYPSSKGLPNEERSAPVPFPIDTVINRVRRVAGPDAPIWFSETGYSQPSNGIVGPGTSESKDVSGRAVAKYIPRLLAHHFRNPEIKKTFIYELLSTNRGTPWGLVRFDFSRTPAFYATRNLITLCKEATWNVAAKEWITPSDYTPQPLDYTLEGDLTNVEQLLLQKSDGTYLLLLWQEVPSFDPVTRTDVVHPLRDIRVVLNRSMASSVNVYRLYNPEDSAAALAPLETYEQTSQLTVGVPDDIVALEITLSPGQEAASGTYRLRNKRYNQWLTANSDGSVTQDNDNTGNQRVWALRQLGASKRYVLKNQQFGRTLNATASGVVNLSPLGDGGPDQEWFPENTSGNFYTLKNVAASTSAGTKDWLDGDAGGVVKLGGQPLASDDEWELYPANTPATAFQGTYKLLARHSGKALAVDLNEQTNGGFSDATTDGVNVFQFGTDNDPNRLWNLQPVGDGYHKIISVYSSKALAVDRNQDTNGGYSDATANGVNVFQYGTSEDEDDNRLWKIEQAADGYYTLTSKYSGRTLDVAQASEVDGANVQQWGTGSQNPIHRQWQLVAVNNNAREAAVSKPKAEGLLTPGSEVRLYPNPASEQLTVEAAGREDYQVMMYDLTGRLMLQHEHLSGNTELDISHLRPGVYLLKLRDSEQGEIRQRVLVE